MSSLAIIPARSGSKRLEDKNIKLLNGKPMLAYTIEAAKKAELFDQIHVSTDSAHYAEIASQYGADIPFLRPAKLSSDSSSSWDVVKNVLLEYRGIGQKFDIVTLLQPTSPLRDSNDIKNAMTLFQNKEAKAVVSVCELEYSPLLCGMIPDDLSMENFMKHKKHKKEKGGGGPLFRLNGAIYILDCDFLFESDNIYRLGCYAYIMEPEKSIDVNTPFDFKIAESLMSSVTENIITG